MSIQRFTKATQLKKLMKDADKILLECTLGQLKTYLPIQKEDILKCIEEWKDHGGIDPLDVVWEGGDPESKTLIIYNTFGD